MTTTTQKMPARDARGRRLSVRHLRNGRHAACGQTNPRYMSDNPTDVDCQRCLRTCQPLPSAVVYCPVRKATDDGHEWIDVTAASGSSDVAALKAARNDALAPSWAQANPVARYDAFALLSPSVPALLQTMATARTNGLDDVDLVALIQSWQREAQRLLAVRRD